VVTSIPIGVRVGLTLVFRFHITMIKGLKILWRKFIVFSINMTRFFYRRYKFLGEKLGLYYIGLGIFVILVDIYTFFLLTLVVIPAAYKTYWREPLLAFCHAVVKIIKSWLF